MTTRDEIEARLLRAVDVTPSQDALRWLDKRVAQMTARPVAIHRRGLFTSRMFLRPLVLVVALLLLAGAVAAGLGLLERLASASPGWRVAWDRAEIIGIRSTDAGYTLTLQRAYADLNQAVVFVTIEGLPAPRSSDGVLTDHSKIWDADLRDPTGQRPALSTGIDGAEVGLGAAVRSFQFEAPASVAGTFELTITSFGYGGDGPTCVSSCVSDKISGSWRFQFELPKPGGTVVSPNASATVGQATLTLTELRVTPTMVSARIEMYVGDSPVAYWSFRPSKDDLRHGDTSYGLWSGRHILDEAPFEEGPAIEFSTDAGSDEAAGTWQIVIPELDYAMSTCDAPCPEEEIHLAGPWTLTVTVP